MDKNAGKADILLSRDIKKNPASTETRQAILMIKEDSIGKTLKRKGLLE